MEFNGDCVSKFFQLLLFIDMYLIILFDVFFAAVLVFLIMKVSKNIHFKLPIISEIAEKYVLHWFK